MSSRIALYGGSFNPIHVGHLITARAVAEQRTLDRVIFLPSARPPHKTDQNLAAPEHRAEMVRLAIAGDPLFELSDFDMTRPGPSYTLETVTHFRQSLGPGVALHWLIGADSLVELPTWYRAVDLVDACSIITAVRPGWDVIAWDNLGRVFRADQIRRLQDGLVSTSPIDISSTQIRDRLRQGQSIHALVPDAVERYIAANALYGA